MAAPDSNNDGTLDPSSAPAPADRNASDDESSQALYLRLMTTRLMGWHDPRGMLERALREDQFLLLAQKILPVKSGIPEPQSYEVLLRLKQEEDSLLPPGGFLDLADSLGMMEDIDRWVVRALLSWGASRLKNNPAWRAPMMCVNISTAAIRNPSFANAVREELARSGFPSRALCFEIDERDVIEHPESVRDFVAALKPGCRMMVDNFGGVKVTFSHLTGIDIDLLKIDGMLIQNIDHDPTELIKTWAINLACQKLGVRTVAKFVESKATLDMLREIEIDYVQGFGIARPVPIETLTD